MIDKFQIQKLEAMPIEGVAERLGLTVIRHVARCPFHDDTHPSLTFNIYRNRYRCFVCDAHGGVIDLVMNYRHCSFREACAWLGEPSVSRSPLSNGTPSPLPSGTPSLSALPSARRCNAPAGRSVTPDLEWLSALVRYKVLNPEARRFLFEERKIDPRVVAWCGLTSISQPAPCWRYGKPFYDAPSLLIPYYDVDGRLVSVQSRYLGNPLPLASEANDLDEGQPRLGCPSVRPAGAELAERIEPGYGEAGEEGPLPRFKFPRGSDCHIYNLQILRFLQPGEELWITEGCSDCWAMLSSGRKAIAIPSATLLKDKDLEPLRRVCAPPSAGGLGGSLHMYPDQDRPGEKLFLELREKLSPYAGGAGEGLQRHQLPEGCKDFGEYWKKLNVKS